MGLSLHDTANLLPKVLYLLPQPVLILLRSLVSDEFSQLGLGLGNLTFQTGNLRSAAVRVASPRTA